MDTEQYTVKIISKKKLTHDTVELITERPEDLDFIAGQFVQFVIPGTEKICKRSYSIASTPDENILIFCIKLLENGKASNYLKTVRERDTLTITPAQGRFIVQNPDSAIHFIATGTGIAPIYSMLKNELKNKNPNHISLLHGLRHKKDLFWHDELNRLEKKYPNFSYTVTLSQPKTMWEGLTGRVTKYIEELPETGEFYLCGSVNMVQDVRKLLLKKGVTPSAIHFEIF